MANISITYEGPPAQRQAIKATAMAPLSALLAEACSRMKPPLDPAHASLVFNKKPLTDMSCPFRLANIPAGSALTLVYNKPVIMELDEAGFRTRAAREADEAARAASYGRVLIRVHLPGDAILQATFAATEPVSALRSAVLRVLSPRLAGAAYLYTTPPRQVLAPAADGESLYHVGLVPAAHVHVGLDSHKAAASGHTGGPVLREELQSRLRSRIDPEVAVLHGSRQQPGEQAPQGARAGAGAAAAREGSAVDGRAPGDGASGSGGASGGAKVPKWLKLGGR
ncbi:hypothetical protein GPECTOR_34g780 [Gonium pectorale]|uniref:TUG ubiquitin-like domain-containing protein n=1 Tax=Gonium pectorale TaxID=33097 RepID=A0A150GCN9_GONPE|nr:hypothetical protein GPECTOR_34g780 [Gonium pectorale]|eukprot:KXZ47621.1 hypothetical protein GPECTOR_34g780 [Gonium pectorale]